MKIKRHVLWLSLFLIVLLLIGVNSFHYIEGWSYFDSFYFLVITATTVGYGDITPSTNMGKILTMVYSFVGIAIVFYFVSVINSYIFEKKIKHHIKKEENIKINKKRKNNN